MHKVNKYQVSKTKFLPGRENLEDVDEVKEALRMMKVRKVVEWLKFPLRFGSSWATWVYAG